MNRKTIAQIVHKYAIINTVTNEWLYEGSTYSACVHMVPGCVPAGAEYVIVAVMKEGTYKPKPERKTT
jgi:hypothetical protein